MSIRDQVKQLIKSYPELERPENSNRVIRILWAEDKSLRAETILRAIRAVVRKKKLNNL